MAALHVLLRSCEHRVLQVLYPLMEVCAAALAVARYVTLESMFRSQSLCPSLLRVTAPGGALRSMAAGRHIKSAARQSSRLLHETNLGMCIDRLRGAANSQKSCLVPSRAVAAPLLPQPAERAAGATGAGAHLRAPGAAPRQPLRHGAARCETPAITPLSMLCFSLCSVDISLHLRCQLRVL